MKNLKVGDKVRCKKDVVMTGYKEGIIAFIKGKEYISEINDCLTNEQGNQSHWVSFDGDDWLNEYFELVKPTHPLPPAVLVQNEREFKIVMKDFEKKGWIWKSGIKPTHFNSLGPNYFDKNGCYVECCDKFCIAPSLDNRPILSFDDYALIAGIEVPNWDEITLDSGIVALVRDGGIVLQESIQYLSMNDLKKLHELYQSLQK